MNIQNTFELMIHVEAGKGKFVFVFKKNIKKKKKKKRIPLKTILVWRRSTKPISCVQYTAFEHNV